MDGVAALCGVGAPLPAVANEPPEVGVAFRILPEKGS